MTPSTQHPASYSVPIGHSGSSHCVEWRWPDSSLAQWSMAEKDGVSWISMGELTEEGRQAILEHFELTAMADSLPLEELATRSPKELELMYFGRANTPREGPKHHRSDRIGAHIPAMEAV